MLLDIINRIFFKPKDNTFNPRYREKNNTARCGTSQKYTIHNNRYSSPVLEMRIVPWRSKALLFLILLAFAIAVGYAVMQQINNRDFLQAEGEKRYEVELTLPANRGRIEDRNGSFLASSMPVRGVWMIPDELASATPAQFKLMAKNLALSEKYIRKKIADHKGKTFVYLKRQVAMRNVERLQAAKIKGLNFSLEVKRFYPQGPLMSHLVGFTNVENNGIEGLEKELNDLLQGDAGKRVVIRDRLGRIVEDVNNLIPARDGQTIRLTIDSQIQLLAYKAVEKAVKSHDAESGGAVVIDTQTGEILGMVSYPSYDPNNPFERKGVALRNRVITDTFEPGSIIKPLVAALALDAGAINTETKFATGNGSYHYQGHTITDVSRFNGTLDVQGILRRSSNIGMTMISDRLGAVQMWTVFRALGFGQRPDIGFPGAAAGRLRPWKKWRLIEKATMSYGYGLSVSLLQVAQAYTALARNGDMISLSLLKDNAGSTSIQVFSPRIAKEVRAMLEDASGSAGTKIQAKVNGYRIAGKSGTARQIVNGKYSHNLFRGSFVALAPVSQPRIVVAVTMNRPKKEGYYGTVVSGPVVAEIIEGTLKYLGVPPDAPLAPTLEASNSSQLEASNSSQPVVGSRG